MEDNKAHKIIFRLTNAVIVLSIMVIGLVITIFVLYAFSPRHAQDGINYGFCGVTGTEDLQPGCGNAFNNEDMAVFDRECAACHFINRDMTGPTIKGAFYRGSYTGWFRDFITNQDSLLQAGDEYTLRLKEDWGNMGWNHQYDYLPETDLEALERLAR